jgi:hypothetical protein
MKACSFLLCIVLFVINSLTLFSQDYRDIKLNLQSGDFTDSPALKETIKNSSLKKEHKVEFSLGGGAFFRYDFAYSEFLLGTSIGFKLSKHFALVSGAEFTLLKSA